MTPRPEYADPAVVAAAAALRHIHPSFFRVMYGPRRDEAEKQSAALEVAYRVLHPTAPDWGRWAGTASRQPSAPNLLAQVQAAGRVIHDHVNGEEFWPRTEYRPGELWDEIAAEALAAAKEVHTP